MSEAEDDGDSPTKVMIKSKQKREKGGSIQRQPETTKKNRQEIIAPSRDAVLRNTNNIHNIGTWHMSKK